MFKFNDRNTRKICEIGKRFTTHKMKFFIKNFFSKCWSKLQETADLVTFTEEILNGKLHFLCSVCWEVSSKLTIYPLDQDEASPYSLLLQFNKFFFLFLLVALKNFICVWLVINVAQYKVISHPLNEFYFLLNLFISFIFYYKMKRYLTTSFAQNS